MTPPAIRAVTDARFPPASARARAHEVMELTGMTDVARVVSRNLSHGDQKLLDIALALALEPRVLLLDEPTEGLQPSMVARIREVVEGLRESGVATLLVEQRVEAVHALADRVTFLENGRMRETIPGAELDTHSALFHRYVGIGT